MSGWVPSFGNILLGGVLVAPGGVISLAKQLVGRATLQRFRLVYMDATGSTQRKGDKSPNQYDMLQVQRGPAIHMYYRHVQIYEKGV